ncbi:MAG: ATPase [Sulfuricurvum sp. PD_MW2]|jgi:ATP-dependent exoDNAse (exonuclease V) alpha subunit|uniref:ATP-dependent DNA helicase n=1 Tax=Sulfuricurvum sp. PD_MW2 TaxID=2027917 RepID=UPI000C0610D3|nr:DEAD/DEAH box helicase [Sulfuricurvum sp. PD_MW2]PHM18095.1 MAG: ATPase [Sulfuricurvum sp. PD_MW2]
MIETALSILENSNLFITGGAGSGKTTLTRAIIDRYQKEGKSVARLASTGMAATLIGGQTLHSFFDLGIANSQEELERNGKLEPAKKIIKLIRSMQLIVIDEISMVGAQLLDMIRLRLLQAEFGGRLIVVGDFLQLPPVTRGNEPIYFAFESPSWERLGFETLHLEGSYRTHEAEFLSLLEKVRHARLDEAAHEALEALVKPLNEDMSTMTLLFGKNISAQNHNRAQLEHLHGEMMEVETYVTIHDKKMQDRDVERFMIESRIEGVLTLKVGAPILFTRNAWNYYNGERGVITSIEEDVIWVKKEGGASVKVERVDTIKTRWIEKGSSTIEEKLITLSQFPLTLAFAITIHKSQGMSLADYVIETNEIFAPSQFYVALSRSVSAHRVTLIKPHRGWEKLCFVHPKAKYFSERL